MKTASVVTMPHGQSVCLPDEFRFDGDEVFIKRVGRSILLIPKQQPTWQSLVDSLDQFSPDFMQDRAQPDPQQREAIFE
jgi:antitoxin VapB